MFLLLLAASHSLIVPSSDPDATVLLSGEKATAVIEELCPLSICFSSPVATSYSLVVRFWNNRSVVDLEA